MKTAYRKILKDYEIQTATGCIEKKAAGKWVLCLPGLDKEDKYCVTCEHSVYYVEKELLSEMTKDSISPEEGEYSELLTAEKSDALKKADEIIYLGVKYRVPEDKREDLHKWLSENSI